MKTRTLLLLSVATALMILVAGGVLLVQLTGAERTTQPTDFGERVEVGDLEVTVFGVDGDDGLLSVDVEVGGVDDDLDSVRLITGDRTLSPISSPASARCTEFIEDVRRCTIDFDTSSSDASNRVLVIRRGDDQATWRL